MYQPRFCLHLLLGLALAGTAGAKVTPNYRYGEQWWSEYASDKYTDLLLHFGAPQVSGREQVQAGMKTAEREELLEPDLESIDEQARADTRLQAMPAQDMGLPPVEEAKAGPGEVLDYSDKRRVLRLASGQSLVADGGRFGGGLRLTGQGGLRVASGAVDSVECWFRVDAHPAQESCLFSVADDQARLLLRPDGKLELRLKNPHGVFDRKRVSEAAMQAFLKRDALIESRAPVPLGQWTHVVIRKVAHPTPGNNAPWDVRLVVNGNSDDGYLSDAGNLGDDFFGRHQAEVVIGDSAAGGQPFSGTVDEVRISTRERVFYERPPMPWRDGAATRPLQFGTPWFRSDGLLFHASFEKGFALERAPAGGGAIELDLKNQDPVGLQVDGIRGKGWVIDRAIGLPRIPLKGASLEQGALEFWLRPVNWDDVTGYWHHSPPPEKTLSVARLYARHKASGKVQLWLSVGLDRAYNLERERLPLDPGHWLHLVLTWHGGPKAGAALCVNGTKWQGVRREQGVDPAAWEPAYVEFGVANDVTAKNGEAPRIELDEVVGYGVALAQDEIRQAMARWQGELQPIALYNAQFSFKHSLQKLEFRALPLLPAGVTAQKCRVALHDRAAGAKPVIGPAESADAQEDGFRFLLSEGKPLPYGEYEFRFSLLDAAGKSVAEGILPWKYEEESWRRCNAGVLETVPPPWTPLKLEGPVLSSRMTRYTLGAAGLPEQIRADGVDLLAGPVRLLEDGRPLAGEPFTPGAARPTDVAWSGRFAGASCDLRVACRAEYDGMVRLELQVQPKGATVQPLALEIPLRPEYGERFLYYPMGARGVVTGNGPAGDGPVFSSKPKDKDGYGFFGHLDLNDRHRGLWWFCDNAAGWVQSPTVAAIEAVRQGDAVVLRLNLVAVAGPYPETRPIVFALLPHPARPMPEKYRLFERADPKSEPLACDIFDAFFPWPQDPRDHSMKLYPAADPAKPEAGPSWEYAESCKPSIHGAKTRGYRTMYLSRAWFSCRAGSYDGWEWRSGESMAASLTPAFVNYLCWEMNEWLGRGIFNAIYLDECYEMPARNLEAGFSVRLPDGSEQPGVTNFAFRELMKRWRNLFHQHGLEPMLIAHHTYSFQYHGLVFCDAYLDGENAPIVHLNGRDWMDSVGRSKYEVIQNQRMWGMGAFWMPFIAEGGFEDKEKSRFPRWQWRMARQAQGMFAHYEIATVYEGQGAEVYKAYWQDLLGWGVGDPAVPFRAYWETAPYLQVDGQGGDTLVSFYQGKGRILLIATSLARTPRELRIRLKRDALGLKPDARAVSLDSCLAPPAGEDFSKEELAKAAVPQEKDPAALLATDDELGEAALEDPAVKEAGADPEFAPRLEADGTLVVPVRARDYRVIAIE